MFDKLKGIFFEKDDDSEEVPKLESKKYIGKEQKTRCSTSDVKSNCDDKSKSVDPKMLKFLNKSIDDANMNGFDYAEFRESLSKMDVSHISEKNKFLAVFATAQTMGLSKKNLLLSIDYYHDVLKDQRKKFLEQFEHTLKKNVFSCMDDIEKKKKEIKEAKIEIERITKSIEITQKEINDHQIKVKTKKSEIESSRESFEASYEYMIDTLMKDKEKIVNYIGEDDTQPKD